MLFQKTVFGSQIWVKNLQKKTKFIQKKNVLSGFLHIEINVGFWEHIVRYQRTQIFPIFFFILNCFFSMNWNPVLELHHRWIYNSQVFIYVSVGLRAAKTLLEIFRSRSYDINLKWWNLKYKTKQKSV